MCNRFFLNRGSAQKSSFAQSSGHNRKTMSVEDFVLDWEKVRGEVTVTGRAGCINTTCYLYSKHLTSNLMFNTERLPRKDRRRLMKCDPLTIPCNIPLTGYGGADLLHPFVPTSVEWEH